MEDKVYHSLIMDYLKGVYKTFKKLYINNLSKALKLFKGIDNNDEIKYIVYKQKKIRI